MALVTSSKKTIGLCFGAYSPVAVSGQVVPEMSSWYDFHEMPAASSCVTRCCVVLWWFELGSLSLVTPKLVPASSHR